MARKIPPFAALRAFEALARRGSLQGAADELLISSSAVSHQVKSLETFLSSKLVVRGAGGLKLTPTGEAFVSGLGDALDRIEAATLAVLQTRRKAGVTLHTFQSLAQFWLIPQLSDFLAANPEISVRMVTDGEPVDLSGTDIDLAIQYGPARPAEAHFAEKLIDETIFPVCSPDFIQKNGPIERPEDLLGLRLIGCNYIMDEWNEYFRAIGLETAAIEETRLTFDKRSHALQAAANGLGIAMARTPMSTLLIQRGQIIPVFAHKVPTGHAYYVVAPERSVGLPHVKQFRAWLRVISQPYLEDRAAAE